jgi:hypothetical protein
MSSKNLPYILLLLLCLSSSSGSALLAYLWSTGGEGGEGDASGEGGEGDASVPCQGGWSDWSDCSLACGGGTRSRTWTTSPGGEPLNGGTACPSPLTQEEACNTGACPAEPCKGGWSGWSDCSATCGGGIKTRTWTTSPGGEPKYGGTACPSPKIESDDCNTQACPSTSPAPENCQGSLSGWSDWSDCSATCGGGIKTRTKTWTTSPGGEPKHGGTACPSPTTQEEACNTQACSVNWNGSTTNTSGSPIWEEFPSLKLSGTKLRALDGGNGNISPAECKQKCIDNPACGGITTKSEKYCYLYGGDAMPNPTSVRNWWVSYTLVR